MTLRLGIIGMGGVGMHHASYLARDLQNTVSLAAFSTRDPDRLARAHTQFPAATPFSDHQLLLASGSCDAVLICTPHFQHLPILQEALAAGCHVLVEKPLAVTLAAAKQIIHAANAHPHLVCGIMLNQRTLPLHQEIRRRILNGELGNLTRLTWIATHWFRPDAYFRSSPWRATWKGEGGGVLINQAHHNLDLLYWLTGMMPRTITAVGSRGKHHPIETEDEVSAILEYESGMVAHFITSTGEAPGTNRLEIAGTRGKLVAEDGKLTFHRLAADSRDFSKSATEPFSAPPVTVEPVPLAPAPSPDHRPIVEDFAAIIAAKKTSAALLAPAADALPAIELSNALLMAALTRHPVPLPLDCPTYDAFLARMSAS